MTNKEMYFSKIEDLREAADFMRVLRKWRTLSERIDAEGQKPMVLPDLLWVARSGVGKTNLLKLLSEYLCECGNLMTFHGNVKYFEFMLDYCPLNEKFSEIERLINEVRTAAGFRNLYRGIISIDIEQWLGHVEEKNFISFLEYLSSNSDDWLVVFNVTGDKEEEIGQLESILSMYFRLEKSVLSLPETEALVDYVEDKLSVYGLSLDESARALIYGAIETLRANKYFDGYKTLLILSQDIVYEIFSAKEMVSKKIDAAALRRFAPDTPYIKRASWRAERKNRIGLIKWEEE